MKEKKERSVYIAAPACPSDARRTSDWLRGEDDGGKSR